MSPATVPAEHGGAGAGRLRLPSTGATQVTRSEVAVRRGGVVSQTAVKAAGCGELMASFHI